VKPTGVRYVLLGVATANAFLLYLDRICMAAVVQSASFQREMALDPQRTGDVLASFFFAYALGQMPAGWLADRFGPRRMLVAYIALWSLCTGLTGFATGLLALVIVRCACGLAEAGAYPSSGLLIARWFPFYHLARANSVVAFGGRVGNAIALWLTAGRLRLSARGGPCCGPTAQSVWPSLRPLTSSSATRHESIPGRTKPSVRWCHP